MFGHRDRGWDGPRKSERLQAAQPSGKASGERPACRRRTDWNADTDFDVRLQDVPLNNRRPDVTVYRAETIDITPTRPEHVLLVDRRYRDGEVFTGVVKLTAPFPAEIDLSQL